MLRLRSLILMDVAWCPNAFDADADIQFNAASEQTLTFRFTADTTTIKGGTVSIRMPSGWSPTPVLPNDDDDNAGRTKATMYDNDANAYWILAILRGS